MDVTKKPLTEKKPNKLNFKKLKQKSLNSNEKKILNLISKNDKISFNEIQEQLQIKTPSLTVLLTNLEIKQLTQAKFGNFYKLHNNAVRDLLV